MGQGESLAMTLDPFVQRQGLGRETSDSEPRHKHTGRGEKDMGHAPENFISQPVRVSRHRLVLPHR